MNASEGSVTVLRRQRKKEMDQTLIANSSKEGKIGNKSSSNNKKMIQQQTLNRGNNDNCSKIYGLCSYQELPDYMKDNEYILNYYRADWPLKQALFSIFQWHNETLNVWTHLIGFILFLGLTIINLMHVPQVADFFNTLSWSSPSSAGADVSNISILGIPIFLNPKPVMPENMGPPSDLPVTKWPFFVFLAGSMFCLLSSSACHLFSCHSHHLNLQLLRMDYAGITIMIITSFFPPIYYIFQCNFHWQLTYLGGITIMGIFTVVTLLSPQLSTGKFRSYRTFLFVGMGFFGLVPAVHAIILNWREPQRNVTLAYEIAMALSYLVGALFYVCRIPERWRPGWFDLAGHSCLGIINALHNLGEKARWPKKSDKLSIWKDKSKWCAYHEDFGHITKSCIALRKEIAYLLSKGMLKKLLEKRHGRSDEHAGN